MIAPSATDSELLNDFREGVRFFEVGNYEIAIEFFTEVCSLVGSSDPDYNRYRSWLGLTQSMQGERGGLVLCRLAGKDEARHAEVFLNLARAERQFGDVDKCLRALEQGRRIDPAHPAILNLLGQLDRRRDPALPFLSRNNPLNRWAGRFTWWLAQRRTQKAALQQ